MKVLKIKFKSILSNLPWFWMAMTTLFGSSLALRFCQLNRFNRLVFDEIYFVKYAKNYLNNTPFFDVHPPLGKYLIALGIWLSHFWVRSSENQITAFDYRWLNALIGSFIPLIIAGIAYQLSHRHSYAFLAGLFAAADGLLLVESRYALLNIYLIFFGFLGQWFFLLALTNHSRLCRGLYLIITGICFGAAVSVKWYGLGFVLSTYLLWVSIRIVQGLQFYLDFSELKKEIIKPAFWQNLTQVKIPTLLLCLGAIPAIVYYLLWIPHLQLNPTRNFWELHQASWRFHQQLGNGTSVHPYCSTWYSWVLMIRPVAYWYEKSGNLIYDVHGMGNPVLWWLAAIAILLLVGKVVQQIQAGTTENAKFWIPLYLLLNYGANWLPWMMVNRCAFLYYYMGAAIFGFLAIAYWVDRWLSSDSHWWRAIAVQIIFLNLAAFTYWLPLYLGLPLSSDEFHRRMWFPSWY
jgi:dolichyl-phosphate-mannose--protein O-mannosyl transferase